MRPAILWLAAGLALAGCGSTTPVVRMEPGPDLVPAALAAAEPSKLVAGSDEPSVQASRADRAGGLFSDEIEQYDPWEPFNEKTFEFNYRLDRHVLKPAANVYRRILPDELQAAIANGFDNLGFLPRVVNSLLQGKWEGALRELGRFVINSTAGIGGLFDVARTAGLKESDEDFGQTLGVWGSGPGPYLVLPFLDPMTVRDGIGRGVDGVLDPLSWLLPLFPVRLGMKAGDVVNDRALNYELFQGVEETTLDLYSSVRHFYLQRREQQIKE